jgi:hypothetical protein
MARTMSRTVWLRMAHIITPEQRILSHFVALLAPPAGRAGTALLECHRRRF